MNSQINRNNESKMIACLKPNRNSQRADAKGFQTCLLSSSKLRNSGKWHLSLITKKNLICTRLKTDIKSEYNGSSNTMERIFQPKLKTPQANQEQ